MKSFCVILYPEGDLMQYFLDTADTIGPGHGFAHFDGYHCLWFALLAVCAVVISIQYQKSSPAGRQKWRRGMAIAILLDEVWKMFWLAVGGNYTLEFLPLHLCSINIFIIAWHAWRPNKTLDNYLYGVCIPGAVAAMLFPTWSVLPALNFMHLHSFTIHMMLIIYPIMQVVGGDIRPEVRQLPKCVLFTALMAVPVYLFNLVFDTNFMFLMYAEEGNPLLIFENLFGSHLIGIPVLGGLFLAVMYGILYLCRRLAKARSAKTW